MNPSTRLSFPAARITWILILAGIACIVSLSVAVSVNAGVEPQYSITKFTIDGGGGTSTGGVYSLSGTIGQHDASPAPATGGGYTVVGGFWGGVAQALGELIFSDSYES